MSASLVGSEMCIRDRSPRGARRPQCATPKIAGVPDVRLLQDRDKGVSPVSYTHLTLPTICSV
eukprot:9001358-Alexandrium_andersonii.AAC.1